MTTLLFPKNGVYIPINSGLFFQSLPQHKIYAAKYPHRQISLIILTRFFARTLTTTDNSVNYNLSQNNALEMATMD
jgi:hypothetical protein